LLSIAVLGSSRAAEDSPDYSHALELGSLIGTVYFNR